METPKVRRKHRYILGGISVLFGAFFLVVFILGRIDEHAFVAHAIHVPGTVTGLIKNTSGRLRSPSEFPKVTFKTLDGRVFWHIDRLAGGGYSLGEHVEVLYNPQNPIKARIGPVTDTWGPYVFFTLFFGFFIVFGIATMVWGG